MGASTATPSSTLGAGIGAAAAPAAAFGWARGLSVQPAAAAAIDMIAIIDFRIALLPPLLRLNEPSILSRGRLIASDLRPFGAFREQGLVE